ncbi:DEAD/DEAH box helicase [Halococcus sediminicola]|uniref:DEAD/DEAH box helicase n=1 Tax=Halococcus sediminicola TaxID=1264579 RepID=UPI00067908EB|nr:DEAD/DEAH box helicase [Halococcus sediminicola]
MSDTQKPGADSLAKTYPHYSGQVVYDHTQPAADANTVPAADVLEPGLANRLPHDLYTHQAEALSLLEAGENVCVATSTSSGKTFVYGLHIARQHYRQKDSTALLVYPTKALSRDQKQALDDLYTTLGLDIDVAVYDGDTPSNERRRAREESDVIISNFAGVNVYLSDHALWKEFYSHLDLIAIDESHSYTGIQGMHVAWVIRRLWRVLDRYGVDPQVTLTSATIGNPKEHAELLTAKAVQVVDEDGSPHGKRKIVFWDPPTEIDNNGEEIKRSVNEEASDVLAHLADRDLQTLMFTRSRKQTELNARRVRNADEDLVPTGELNVEAYNAGHGKDVRQQAEDKLKNGKLDGIVSTNALELGIDIGSVDATILTGYPGTRQSFWQQVGRSGRGLSDALGVFVANHDSIDQYILDHPQYILGDTIEDAVIDTTNNPVYAQHLLCASEEIPLTHEDSQWFGEERLERAVKMWRRAGKMVGRLDTGVQYNGPHRPQMDISMYATKSEQFEVRVKNGEIDMEPIDKVRAYRDFHEGAIHLHKGTEYEIIELNEEGAHPFVLLERTNAEYYTQTLSEITISDLDQQNSHDLGDDITLCYGEATVNVDYYAYKKIKYSRDSGGLQLSTGLDPIEMRTQLMWVAFPEGTLNDLNEQMKIDVDPEVLLGGLHAAEHGTIGMAPLELRLDKGDLGGLSQRRHPELDGPVWFVYDGVGGGLGFSRAIFNNYETIATHTRDMIDNCGCEGEDGCPACVMESNCGDDNSPLHRSMAVELLEKTLTGYQTDS